MKVLKRKQSGFTLLEMSIVLFIISLLVLIMLPNLSQQRKHANVIHGKAMVSVIQTQIDAYENENGTDNVGLDELKNANYLTAAQVQQAHRERIVIVDGKAIQR
ncbi:prepilin-type N-terminal cleavage/methylation domain-containing protein [Lactobacillus sp. 0.1XD8-4]|uniref:Prepilin-type N-terminal cleavage/methylation domain-containing protein n=1 Tax=Limosilactobacillus walteri TaxID=2268022 RepID=A0ABR8P6S3_9LACO|nr:competence type IV pilus major pilin ComGC [Limosilactobacillus walteri]MBD5806440.1 prepilin-type N-terminal cleavage/methylation domain-containing protein [Limosilactobacillus walteri]MRN07557.1 prepilin-type N-terminal cleavage/methylation domain-containing protein [Lactobacillus sp. 0.1XD8-4]